MSLVIKIHIELAWLNWYGRFSWAPCIFLPRRTVGGGWGMGFNLYRLILRIHIEKKK